jgi:predicted aldo/keto reductase-like oxidoreductase
VHCPEHIALVNMIRYHSYLHQYKEEAMARRFYAQAGYDPAKVCTSCGKCEEVCASGVRVTDILHQVSVQLA